MTITAMVNNWRDDFSILNNEQTPLIYFDNAATTLKPKPVLDAIQYFYSNATANVGRSSHFLAESITEHYERAREKVASFINAKQHEIIFTHNGTDAINLLARSLKLSPDDEVVTSILEHHSNFLPWHERAHVIIAPIDMTGLVDVDFIKDHLSKKTKIISVTAVSNVTGNIQPIKEIATLARENNILFHIDAAQAVGHIPVDVLDIGCDFLTFSGHKMLGPSGVGVLYVRNEIMSRLSPEQFGGGMVNKIYPTHVEYMPGYKQFEAGTPNIEGILGLSAAIDYLNDLDTEFVFNYMSYLEEYCRKKINSVNSISLPFTIAQDRHCPIFSFRPKNSSANLTQLSQLLSDVHRIAVRSGYQCAQPLYQSANLDGSIRLSLYLYNTTDEVDMLINALNSLECFLM